MCSLLDEKDVKSYINDNEYDEDELKNLGLDDEEIEEVQKGNQSPYDFIDDPDEDFEDDDYYGEDDL